MKMRSSVISFYILLAVGVQFSLETLACADSVFFKVGPVSIQVLAKNFKAKDMRAYLQCFFNDHSDFFNSYPEKQLALQFKEIENPSDETGTRYQVDISGGTLFAWKPLLNRHSCQYMLIVEDAGLSDAWRTTSGYSMLSDSRDEAYHASLKEFLADHKMNEKISTRYQPLRLEELDGNRVEEVK